ncbi:MAG: dihydropteroate synthase [Phycisphaerae bacterium]|nr:dihydropteroate synthase [Phycisphaerae bacterium]
MPKLLGILNITRDSFSDGGRFLDPTVAIDHGLALARDGADIIDVGAESSHPDSETIHPDDEIARLTPVIRALKDHKLCVSVDAYKPPVIRAAIELGADIINDITGAREPETIRAVANTGVRLIVMHSTATRAHAERREIDPAAIVSHIVAFFEPRIAELTAAGVTRGQIILDPGLGFFIGSNPESSLAVLRGLPQLAALGLPLCISASRKSFVGAILGNVNHPRPVAERAAGTLATEIWSAQAGVAYIRTHDPRALADALKVITTLEGEVRS